MPAAPPTMLDPTAEGTALARAQAELAATQRELEAVLASVSHDLREPLRSLEGFSVALLEDFGAVLQGDGALYLGRLRGAVRRLSDRLDAILALSRLGQAPLRPEAVDLSARFAAAFAALAAAEPGRAVEVTVQPGLATTGDATLLQHLVDHLAHNAWKFSRARQPAHVSVAFDADRQAVAVRDDGAGFDQRFAERIFAPFGRFHAEREFEGLGIGLPIVQRVVHRHHGRVWAEGAVEGGACVWFSLPDLAAPEVRRL